MNDETLRLSLVKFITCRVHKKHSVFLGCFTRQRKYNITKIRTTMNGIKASVLKFVNSFFFFTSHTCTQRSRCSSILFSFFFSFFSFSFSETFYDRVEKNRRKIGFSDFFFFRSFEYISFFPSVIFILRKRRMKLLCSRVGVFE